MKRYSLIAITLLSLSACTSSGGGDDDNNPGPGSGSGSGSGSSTQGTTCAEVLDCITACESDACADSCITDGSTTAQEQILDLAQCIQDSGCTDAACTEAKCGALFDACYGDSGGGGGGDPTGSPLPPALVGTWGHSAAGVLITYQFTADGHITQISTLYTGTGSCDSTYVNHYEGVVQLTGDVLSISVIDGSWTSYGCDGTTPSNSGSITEVDSLRYATGNDAGGPLLTLTNVVTGNTVPYRRQ
jgi:hypothetical protein